MKIIIVGGGKVAAHLVNLLSAEGHHELIVIEDRSETGFKLADMYDVDVINGDGSDIRVLRLAGAQTADMLICLTGNDETNLLVCQLAKLHFGVQTTVARVNNVKNMKVFRKLGVDKIYCGTQILADIIDQAINYAGMKLAFDIPNSSIGILEFFLAPSCDAVGCCLQDYTFPGSAKVVLVTHPDGTVEMPSGRMVMQSGDRMLMAADQKYFEQIWQHLVDKEAVI